MWQLKVVMARVWLPKEEEKERACLVGGRLKRIGIPRVPSVHYVTIPESKRFHGPTVPASSARGKRTWRRTAMSSKNDGPMVHQVESDWKVAIDFFKSLRWCIKDDLCISYTELAYQFHFCGFKFENASTVASISTVIRKVLNQSTKCRSEHPLFVGCRRPQAISQGKALPTG